MNTQHPMLSVIVAIVSDTVDHHGNASHLAGCLDALCQQVAPPPMEIIVPYYPGVDGIEEVKRRFNGVTYNEVHDSKTLGSGRGGREHHDELRARGIAAAHGQIIGLLEDHARPDPYWCAQMAKAHQGSYAAVGGAIENGVDRPLNWAVYFCDFGRYQNPVPAGESAIVSDANVAYKCTALESIRSVWQESFHETVVNEALILHGEKLVLSPGAVVYQYRTGLQPATTLKERFIWGRSYAATRSQMMSSAKRVVYAVLSLILPIILFLRMMRNVTKKGRNVGAFLKASPLIVLLTLSWSFGEFMGYATGHAGRSNASSPEAVTSPGPTAH